MQPTIDPDAAFALIRNRRSLGLSRVSPEPIDRAVIDRLLEAARWAPNHGLTEPWRFTVYAGEARRGLSEAFAEAYRQLNPGDKYSAEQEEVQRQRPWQAPVWMAVTMHRDENPRMPEWEDMVAVGCAVQNMHLLATAYGLCGKWSSGAVSVHPHVVKFVGVQPPSRLLGFFYVGRPAGEWPDCKRGPIEDKVTWAAT
jgi:nitroreductase